MKNRLRIGAHMSVAGGLPNAIERAVGYDFSSLQLFIHSPRVWKARDIPEEEFAEFRKARRVAGITAVVVHAPYLVNVASNLKYVRQKSRKALIEDIQRADAIGADYYVMHPGSPKEDGIEKGIERIADTMCEIYRERPFRVRFLIENTAGGGTSLGGDFGVLAEIYERITTQEPGLRTGFCIDTAHLCARGYVLNTQDGMNTFLRDIRKTITRSNIHVIHANDCRTECGSRHDQHAHIGEGTIGLKGFENMMLVPHFRKCPWILETPKDTPASDAENAEKLKALYNRLNHEPSKS